MTLNVDPWPSVLLTSIVAWCARAIVSANGRPRPWPPPLRARSSDRTARNVRQIFFPNARTHVANGDGNVPALLVERDFDFAA